MVDTEHSFVTTPEQAERLAQRRPVIEFRMKRERYDALGLGCGLTDVREVDIDLGFGPARHRLLSAIANTRVDPGGVADTVLTRWRPA